MAAVTHSAIVVARDQPGFHLGGDSISTREPVDFLREKAVLKFEAGKVVVACALMAYVLMKKASNVAAAAAAAELTSRRAH
jgi:hypothetical protein